MDLHVLSTFNHLKPMKRNPGLFSLDMLESHKCFLFDKSIDWHLVFISCNCNRQKDYSGQSEKQQVGLSMKQKYRNRSKTHSLGCTFISLSTFMYIVLLSLSRMAFFWGGGIHSYKEFIRSKPSLEVRTIQPSKKSSGLNSGQAVLLNKGTFLMVKPLLILMGRGILV